MKKDSTYFYPFYFLSFLIWTIGCSSSEESVFKSGKNEAKPFSKFSKEDAKAAAIAPSTPSEAANGVYFFKLESNSGVTICEGEITLSIMSNFTIKFPNSKAICLGGSVKIDLASILNGVNANGNSKLIDGVGHDGKVLSLESIMGTSFNPPRPMLLGPVFQDLNQYKNYKKTTKHTAKNNSGKSASGQFTVEVFETDANFKTDFIDIKDVIHWGIKAKDFDGLKATDGLIFQNMEWWFSARPILITKIVIEAELSDFIEDKMGMNAIVGVLKVTLALKKYK